MSASVFEVARPTLCFRGLLGVAEPILITGGRAMEQHIDVFATLAVGNRDGVARLCHIDPDENIYNTNLRGL